MIKESLYIYVSVDGVEKSFPVGEKAAVINEWTYNAQRMGGTPTITGTVMHSVCLDDLWTKTEYVKLNGEKFYINQVPTSSKNTDDVRYKHEISLVSERVKLENIYFFDVVTANTDTQYQDRYRSNSTEFSFYGDLAEFVARLNDSLVYSGLYNDGFKVVIDSGVSAGVKEISLSNVYMATALQEIYKTYGLPYYWVGKTCHVGYTENAIPTIFEYGQGKGLLSISKANANYRIFNRITGTGSSDNIPHYYPNKAEDRNDPANGGVWIAPTGKLMPPIYRESKGAERFYNALNDTYNAPDGGKYIFGNPYTADNPMEGIQAFDDIKPTINGITNSAGQLFGEIAGIAFDSDDSDEVDDKGDYIHSYFYVKLHIFNGTYGFNLFKHALAQGGMTFNMTSGNCAQCAFEVGVSEPELVDGHYEFENPVQVTESGNIVAGSYSDKVNFGNIQPRQQDTSQYEVWVALKKENTTFGVVMPNATNNYKPSVGDTFVITNISLPYVYITKAENDLKDALIQYMSENNDEKFTFSITFSRIYLTRNPDTAALLNENARIIVRYNEKDYTLYVTNYTCKADGNILTEVTVELDEKLSIAQNQLKEQMESIAQKYAAGNADSRDILARGQRYFLRKDVRDTAQKQIRFNEGLTVGNFTNMSGGALILNELGQSYGEVDRLKVRLKAYFESLEIQEVNTVGGKVVISPAGAVTLALVDEHRTVALESRQTQTSNGISVPITTEGVGDAVPITTEGVGDSTDEEVDNGIPEGVYRCYFLGEQEGTVLANRWQVGDQAMSKTFNVTAGTHQGVSNHYYWRLVTAVSSESTMLEKDGLKYHWIDLSKTDSDTGSDIPVAADVVAQVGNRTDVTRQNALIFSAVDIYSPSITLYHGIDNYTFLNKEYVEYGVNQSTNKAFFNVFGDAYIGDRRDGNEKEYVKYENGKLDIAGTVHIGGGSTIGNTPIDQYIKDNGGLSEEEVKALIGEDIDKIQNQLDGAIETWFYPGEPTLTNLPASGWTTDDMKDVHLGDLYYDKDTGYGYRFMYDDTKGEYLWYRITDNDIIKALENAAKAQETADGKMKVFARQPLTSESYNVGDIWVNATYPADGSTYNNDILRAITKKDAGVAFSISHWTLASKYTDDSALNAFISVYQQTIADIKTQVDGKAETWRQATDPSTAWTTAELKAEHKGDLWYNTTDNTTWYWNGTKWEPQNVPDSVFDAIDGKADIFVSKPTSGYKKNDLWFLEADYTLSGVAYKHGTLVVAKNDMGAAWSANDWTKKDRYTDDSALDDFKVAYQQTINIINQQIDKKAETWYQATDPAASWTTAAQKSEHEGDLWYNTTTGKTYYYDGTAWQYQDIPQEVFDKIDGKASIYVSKPTSYKKNDLWILEAAYTLSGVAYTKGELVTATADSNTFNAAHWTKKVKYTDDTKAEQALTEIGNTRKELDNLEKGVNTFKNDYDKFASDGVFSSAEVAALQEDARYIESIFQGAKGSYDKVIVNDLLLDDGQSSTAKINLSTAFTQLQTAKNELIAVIQDAVADYKANKFESAEVNSKYSNFNNKYNAFYQALNIAERYITDKTVNNKVKGLDGLLANLALADSTDINGGLILTSMVALRNASDPSKPINAGINGVQNAATDIATWWGGGMKDKQQPDNTFIGDGATSLIRFDGSGYFANGAIWWDKTGQLHADPLSFFVGANYVGLNLALFQFVPNSAKKIQDVTYVIPQAPFKQLNTIDYISIGKIKLSWDAANNALKVESTEDGKTANLYATGGVSALGMSSISGGGGTGGLIETVLGYSDITSTVPNDNVTVFNADTVKKIYDRLVQVEGGALTSVSWGIIQNKPTTLAGYGITDAYTKTQTDSAITSKINALDVASAGGSGKYIQAISQTDGKISATVATMPTALKNPTAITIQKNGTSLGSYDGSAAKTINISDVASAATLSSHTGNTTVHITAAERTKWNKVVTDFAAITGEDTDTIINKWEEVVAFLDTYTEADTLANLLGNKADKTQLANYVTALGTSGNYLTWTKNGATNNITVPYATRSAYADVLRDPVYHDPSHRRSSANINFNNDCGVHAFLATSLMTTGKPTVGDSHILHMEWDNQLSWAAQIALPTAAGESMQWRNQNGTVWQAWITILDTNNYSTTLDSRYVTLGTTQTISGQKTFSKPILHPATVTWLNGMKEGSVINFPTADYDSLVHWKTKNGHISISSHAKAGNSLTFGYMTDAVVTAGSNSLSKSIEFDMANAAIIGVQSIKIGSCTVSWDSANNALKFDKNIYSEGGVSALGMSTVSGGSGGLVESIYRWADLGGTFSDSANDTFNAYTINKIRADLMSADGALSNRITSLEGGAAVSVTTTGSGNAITAISKSGTTITATKGATFLTAHQKIYALTFSEGAFAGKTYNPKSAAATVNIPAKMTHLTNNLFVVGTQTTATNAWTGTVDGLTAYYNGLTVDYYLPFAGTSTAATLNLNGLGAKTVYNGRHGSTTTHYVANSVVRMVYYNGAFHASAYYDSNSTYSGFVNAYCKTAPASAAKVADATNFALTAGVTILVRFTNANTVAGAITLNVQSTGAKPVYINGAASSSSNHTLPAGTYPCYYNGTNWYVYTDGTYRHTNILADKIAKSGGTSAQFLKADGSVDGNSYLTTGTASSTYVKKAGDTMTGLLTAKTNASHSGVKLGDTYLTAISGNVIFQNNSAIRFGADSWDLDVWAGLKYNNSNKYIYLGLADGTIFKANAPRSGGSILTPGISNIYVGNNTTNKVWHAGNDGSGSGLDADLLDGVHASKFPYINNSGSWHVYGNAVAAALADNTAGLSAWAFGETRNYGITYLGILKPSVATCGIAANGTIAVFGQGDTHMGLAIDYDSANLQVFGGSADKIVWRKRVAFTDSSISGNAASATKLATARTINGTSFNGTANITTARWGTARNIGIVNSDGTGTAVTVSVNGSGNVNLKLPATIKAALNGNADTATALTSSAGSATLPVYFSGGKPVACTARSLFSALSSSAATNLSITVGGQNRTIANLYARNLANNFTSRQASMNVCYGDGTLRHFVASSSTTTGKPSVDSNILHMSWDNSAGYDGQLAIPTNHSGHVQWRNMSGKDASGNYVYNSWNTLANLTDNVASATKLQTARTIWGQSFNGTGNVSGTLSGVTGIQFPSHDAYNIGTSTVGARNVYTHWIAGIIGHELYLGADNATHMAIKTNGYVGIGTLNPDVTLDVSGTARIIGKFYIGYQTTNAIEWDSTNSAFKFNGNLYATGGISALGASFLSATSISVSSLTASSLNLGSGDGKKIQFGTGSDDPYIKKSDHNLLIGDLQNSGYIKFISDIGIGEDANFNITVDGDAYLKSLSATSISATSITINGAKFTRSGSEIYVTISGTRYKLTKAVG